MACGAEIQPDTKPRWLTGTWSESVAVVAEDAIENPMIDVDQKMPTPTMVVWKSSRTSEIAKTSTPAKIQGRRRPNRDVVRSDRAPVSGKVMSAKNPAIPE